MLAVRLCDVAPDGASLRLSYGLLNLSHRDGPAEPKPLKPGQRTRLRIPLCAVAHRFAPGHRIRIALSTSYWPIAWPSPRQATVTLHTSECALLLPVRSESGLVPPSFAAAEGAPPTAILSTRPRQLDHPQDRITTDAQTGTVLLSRDRDRGAWHAQDVDVTYDATGLLEFAIHPDDPLSARQSFTLTTTVGRDGWHTRTTAFSHLAATAAHFLLTSRLEAYDGEECVFTRSWTMEIPRDSL
jgi:hypothetical protein